MRASDEYRKEFIKIFESLCRSQSPWTVWADFVEMSACAISNAVDKQNYTERENRYMKTIGKYTDKADRMAFSSLLSIVVKAFEENREQDFLGEIYMMLNLGNDRGGQFFTPYDICRAMAEITTREEAISEIEKHGYFTMNDCACGAGATLIAGANALTDFLKKEKGLNAQNHLMIYAQDIDYITALMCYIQLSFLGFAGCICIGNTLTDPMTEATPRENLWFTPVYFSDVWMTRRILKFLKK